MLDDFFNLADEPDAGVPSCDLDMASNSTADANLTWMGMESDASDLEELDLLAVSSESEDGLLSQDSDSETDDDSDKSHPAIKELSDNIPSERVSGYLNLEGEEEEEEEEEEENFAARTADLPEVVKRLRVQLLGGYTQPDHPSVDDSRGRLLSESEELSLKHYIAWVDSRGTVKGYSLHAKVLQEATKIEILSLYMVRKLASELTGLTSQLVDMCPKSCMAFTGDFKDLNSCIYVRDKRRGPCGQPRFDKKGHPMAQMLYTPITPIIQSLYMNREMAQAMRYRHEHLQKALSKLNPNAPPMIYSDFSNSINHVNQYRYLKLFQKETDTAITISGDGAQLTMKKQSDVWVLIVTILNLPPNMRSKAANIIMPLVIPGPHSPGNVESFVYVLYEELAKLSVGVWSKDALSDKYFLLRVYLCGVLGDMLGSAKLSKMAGHMAIYGCRFSMVRGARPSNNTGIISYYTICIILSYDIAL